MNIPDKAVEAATDALNGCWGGRYYGEAAEEWSSEMRAAVTAAAPILVAQALRDLAEDEGAFYMSTWLRDRATELEKK